MDSSTSSTPHNGNHQHPCIVPSHNQLPASFYMQPYQQPMVNSQQQFEVCHTQPNNRQQSYETHFPPLYYQHDHSNRLLSTPPNQPPHQINGSPISVTPQISTNNDPDLADSSDADTHESSPEWQFVGPTKKRKRTQVQQHSGQPTQAHIHTTNRFEALDQQHADESNDQTPPHTLPTPRPPPIIIYGVLNYKKMVENLTTVTEEETFQCKVLQNDTIKISANSVDTYRKLIRHLNSEKIIHHTYQLKQNRAYRVVIRNLHYSVPVDEISEELRSHGHPVRNIINIRHRVHKHPLSMFYVDLEPQHNNKEVYNLQYLSNMKITVEPPNKTRTILQCTRCQLYGHSKTYCTRPYKCVKCGGGHMTTNCPKPKDTPAKCALCSGSHTANYKGCTVYRDLINARHTQTARHSRQQNITQNITQNTPPILTPQPAAQTTITYSQALKDNNTHNNQDNTGLQLHVFLSEFKAMFTQLMNQNSTILTMLSAILNNKINNGN